MNWEKEVRLIIDWMREKVEDAGAKGLVIGLSGGIDSSVVAVLSKMAFPDNVLGVVMPCNSITKDTEHGLLVAETFNIPVHKIDLTDTFNMLLTNIKAIDRTEPHQLAVANIKPRLRMTTLYYYSGLYNYLVAGTGNRSELEIGYFTKYGDGGVDMEPIGHLLKVDVRELARHLGVPKEIIEKSPSAGLWEGQTDEDEMGITYDELDKYILTGQGTDEVKNKVGRLKKISEHKRNMPPTPDWGRH